MICPVCGASVTKVNNTYYCPNDRIYLGSAVLPSEQREGVQIGATEEFIAKKNGSFSKIFDKVVWVVMAVLYLVVIALIAIGYTSGYLTDSGSIFN